MKKIKPISSDVLRLKQLADALEEQKKLEKTLKKLKDGK